MWTGWGGAVPGPARHVLDVCAFREGPYPVARGEFAPVLVGLSEVPPLFVLAQLGIGNCSLQYLDSMHEI